MRYHVVISFTVSQKRMRQTETRDQKYGVAISDNMGIV